MLFKSVFLLIKITYGLPIICNPLIIEQNHLLLEVVLLWKNDELFTLLIVDVILSYFKKVDFMLVQESTTSMLTNISSFLAFRGITSKWS
jgi:hypothetical protein